MTSGILNLCVNRYDDARVRFNEALSIDNENNLARLMLYLLEWKTDPEKRGGYQSSLSLLDWRSEDEFMGYLVSVLEGRVTEDIALSGWETLSEKAWIAYIVGLKKANRGDMEGAETKLQQAVLDSLPEEWSYFLARAELGRIQQHLKDVKKDNEVLVRYQGSINDFYTKQQAPRSVKENRQAEIKPLLNNLARRDTPLDVKQQLIKRLLTLAPENKIFLVRQAFLSAMSGNWGEALSHNTKYHQKPGRESAARIKSGLLHAQLLKLTEKKDAAETALDTFYRKTSAPWYRTIAKHLLDKKSPDSLTQQAGEHPEHLITAYTALGLWAEGEEDRESAIEHYKGALGSYIDYWVEYDLALEMIKQIRQ